MSTMNFEFQILHFVDDGIHDCVHAAQDFEGVDSGTIYLVRSCNIDRTPISTPPLSMFCIFTLCRILHFGELCFLLKCCPTADRAFDYNFRHRQPLISISAIKQCVCSAAEVCQYCRIVAFAALQQHCTCSKRGSVGECPPRINLAPAHIANSLRQELIVL